MRKSLALALAAGLAGPALLAARSPGASDAPPATHTVRMVMEGTSARFEPAALTIRPGDVVRFVNGAGGPHNVSFDPARVPDDAERTLAAAMPGQIQPLWGPLLTEAGAVYAVTFAGVKPGSYEFFCMPHMAMGMEGVLTVR